MSPPDLTSDDSVLADDLAGIIAACERFEADWKAGRPTRIEDELAAAQESVQRRLFRELLALELELTRRDGRFPDLSTTSPGSPTGPTRSGRSSSAKP